MVEGPRPGLTLPEAAQAGDRCNKAPWCRTLNATAAASADGGSLTRWNELVGVPLEGYWTELLNSDALEYGGSGIGNHGGLYAEAPGHHGRPHRLRLAAPPLGVVVFRSVGGGVA